MAWHAHASELDIRPLVDRLDHTLGGTRADDRLDRTSLRLNVHDEISRHKKSDPHFNAHFTLKLGFIQRTEQRFNDWISHKEHVLEEDLKSHLTHSIDPSSSIPTHESASKQPTTFSPREPWHFSLVKHVKLARKPDFWGLFRASKDVTHGRWLMASVTDAGWGYRSGWQASTEFTPHLKLSDFCTLSLVNAVSTAFKDRTLSTAHGPAAACTLGRRQAMSLSATVGSRIGQGEWAVENYSLNSNLRAQVSNRELFIGFSPQLVFAREFRFHGDPGVSGTIEAIF